MFIQVFGQLPPKKIVPWLGLGFGLVLGLGLGFGDNCFRTVFALAKTSRWINSFVTDLLNSNESYKD